MPDPDRLLRARPEVLDFLLTRRSRPARTLADEGPGRDDLSTLLTAAARCPDHGKLEPWRFVVIAGDARARVAAAARARTTAMGLDAGSIDKASAAFTQGAVIVAVLASPRASDKIPDCEQTMSAGAVCLSLLNAALAAGWGANWLTGPLARDPAFLTATLGAAPGEWVAGFIHIGRETVVPADRPRPDVAALTTWL
ncbi:MAG: nitroreductase family protein [Thermohalobaculum sp.]|nr:nitroreductase family protein [Thermohalobaculum sp.]